MVDLIRLDCQSVLNSNRFASQELSELFALRNHFNDIYLEPPTNKTEIIKISEI